MPGKHFALAGFCAIAIASRPINAGGVIAPGSIDRGVGVVATVGGAIDSGEVVSMAPGLFDERTTLSDKLWYVSGSQRTDISPTGKVGGVGHAYPETDYYMGPMLSLEAYTWMTYEFELISPAYIELRGLLEAGYYTFDIITGNPFAEVTLTGPAGVSLLSSRQNASEDYKESTPFYTSLIEPFPAGQYSLSITAVGNLFAAGYEGTLGSGDANWSVFLDAATMPNPGCPTIEPYLVSATANSEKDDGESVFPSVSGDGRFVAFISNSRGLTDDPYVGGEHVYVHDRVAGETRRLARSDIISGPSVAASGEFVAFFTYDSLVPEDTNQAADIYIYDLLDESYEIASLANSGDLANDESFECAISGNGRFVAFTSLATNLTADGGEIGNHHVFLRDRLLGTTERISVTASGTLDGSWAENPIISEDGRFVAFTSPTTAFVSIPDNNAARDIFVRDRLAGTTSCISVTPSNTTGNGTSYQPRFSSDGRYVAFSSTASDLVATAGNAGFDVFLRDTEQNLTTLITTASDGGPPNGGSRFPSVSGDGRFIAFSSAATNLISGYTNIPGGIFLYDTETDRMRRIDARRNGVITPSGLQQNLALSADGRFLVFDPFSSLDLTSEDLDGLPDVYLVWVEDAFDRLEGDANYDGFVNFTDLNLVLSDYSASGPRLGTDFDQSGVVDFGDLNSVLTGFGWACH